MKIAIGTNIVRGAFGGGNQFSEFLSTYLRRCGHEVSHSLNQSDLDIILMTEPRRWLQSSAFGPIEIAHYLREVNPKALVIHRVNECDERKGTRQVNKQLKLANTIADHTVYIASWLVDLFKPYHFSAAYSIIRNGVDREIFQFRLKQKPVFGEKFKIVTHHWSPNWNKGWDIYAMIDRALDQKRSYEFHYIGNPPSSFHARNIFFHPPCSGAELTQLLAESHLYLTASINEPAGMHHIEGASVGLPVVFRQSGALPEYCSGYGESFRDEGTMWEAIEKIRCGYPAYAKKMCFYANDAKDMGARYLNLFERLLSKRKALIKTRENRGTLSNPMLFRLSYYRYYLLHRSGYQ